MQEGVYLPMCRMKNIREVLNLKVSSILGRPSTVFPYSLYSIMGLQLIEFQAFLFIDLLSRKSYA